MTGTQISDMTLSATLPDGGMVPFVVETSGGGFSSLLNYRYDLGADLLTRVSYAALAASDGSGLVGFIADSGAALARTAEDKFRDTISVKDFGATGDGVTDDSAAVQAAVTYAESLTPVAAVYAPGGQYYMADSALAVGKAIMLYGDGPGSSIFLFDDGVNGISAAMPDLTHRGLTIRDLGITCTAAAGTATAGAGLRLHMAYEAIVQNIIIINFYRGLHETQSPLGERDGLVIDHFVDTGMLFNDSIGVGGFNARVKSFTISGHLLAGTKGIVLENHNDLLTFSDGTVSQCDIGLYTDGSAFPTVDAPAFCNFECVDFDRCVTTGLDISFAWAFVFDRCWLSNTGPSAKIGERGSANYISFVNKCRFYNGDVGVAEIFADASYVDFHDAEFLSNNTTGAATTDTLVFGAGCGPFSVANCRFGVDALWPTGGVRYHINIEATGSGEYSLTGNTLADALTANVLDSRAAATRMLRDNFGYLNEAWGSAADTTDGFGDLTITHGLASTPTQVLALALAGVCPAGATVQMHDKGATTFKLRFFDNAGAPITATALAADWQARF